MERTGRNDQVVRPPQTGIVVVEAVLRKDLPTQLGYCRKIPRVILQRDLGKEAARQRLPAPPDERWRKRFGSNTHAPARPRPRPHVTIRRAKTLARSHHKITSVGW